MSILGGLEALGGRHRPHPRQALGVDVEARDGGDGVTCRRALRPVFCTKPPGTPAIEVAAPARRLTALLSWPRVAGANEIAARALAARLRQSWLIECREWPDPGEGSAISSARCLTGRGRPSLGQSAPPGSATSWRARPWRWGRAGERSGRRWGLVRRRRIGATVPTADKARRPGRFRRLSVTGRQPPSAGTPLAHKHRTGRVRSSSCR